MPLIEAGFAMSLLYVSKASNQCLPVFCVLLYLFVLPWGLLYSTMVRSVWGIPPGLVNSAMFCSLGLATGAWYSVNA